MLYDLVIECRNQGIIGDSKIAIDSSAIKAYEENNYTAAQKYGAQAIIPFNLRNEKNRLRVFLPTEQLDVQWDMIWSTGALTAIT
ncbi:imidazole glycerol phosphate synthase subunit HisF [Desulfitispora alkaliphila]|uniref:hypothetical protein n=1 Tax=Desulfitispora alkaliphila TaxID=622674 RepID=UPI003D230689